MGRPTRIRDEDCDVEPLTELDFHFDDIVDSPLILPFETYHISYVIEMVKLLAILGHVLTGRYAPAGPSSDLELDQLGDKLREWDKHLPPVLRSLAVAGDMDASFWACMLHVAYQNTRILLFRPRYGENGSSSEPDKELAVRAAAGAITRIAIGCFRICSANSSRPLPLVKG